MVKNYFRSTHSPQPPWSNDTTRVQVSSTVGGFYHAARPKESKKRVYKVSFCSRKRDEMNAGKPLTPAP